jgi:osmotically-inducible protein OsmY
VNAHQSFAGRRTWFITVDRNSCSAAAYTASNISQELPNMIQINEEFESSQDFEIQESVRAFLNAQNVPSLRRLVVSVSAGTVTLRGQVRTFYERQLSQQCLRRIAGVQQLIDQTVVRQAGIGSGRNELVQS